MTNVSQFQTQRATAGARYAAAVAELHSAWIDLAALDQVLANRNAGGVGYTFQTFKGDVDLRLPVMFNHPLYMPAGWNNPRWSDEVQTQLAAYMATLA